MGRLQGVRDTVRNRAVSRDLVEKTQPGDRRGWLVYPEPPPALLAQTLDLAAQPWKAVANAAIARQHEPPDGWSGAVVCADDDPEGAFAVCRTLRKGDARV